MNEVAIHDLDERLQKQIHQARQALQKGGVDYVVQVCGELLKKCPAAYEVRGLLWDALRKEQSGKPSRMRWLRDRSGGFQFKMATRSLLKNEPLEMVHRCDEMLHSKQLFAEVFNALDKAAKALNWTETSVFACQAVVELDPGKTASRLAFAEALLNVGRPNQAIEQVEWVLAREPANGEAQTLLKNASVAETLQRGNWEDTETTFHTKKLT